MLTLKTVGQAHLGSSESEIKSMHPGNIWKSDYTKDGIKYIYSDMVYGTFYYYFDKETGLSYLCVQFPFNLEALNGQVEAYNKKYVITSDTSWTAYLDQGGLMYIKLRYDQEDNIRFFTYSSSNTNNSNNGKADGNNIIAWSEAQKTEFISSCVNTAVKSLSKDKAEAYCSCMEQKFEIKYPDPNDASKITAEDLQTPEMKAMIQSCLEDANAKNNYNIDVGWSKKDEDRWLDTCAVYSNNKELCLCVLQKIEKKYTSYEEADRLGSEEEGKQMAQECLNERKTNVISSGSGFFISINGYIATNAHVIEGAKKIFVSFSNEIEVSKYAARVVLSDSKNDVAILQITDSNFKSLAIIPFAITEKADIGEKVFTIGYPLNNIMGNNYKVSDGIISSKSGVGDDIRYYQISVPLQPGNSGGPLFNSQGNIIGLTSSRLNSETVGTDIQNVNYAIKSSYLIALYNMISNNNPLPDKSTLIGKELQDQVKILKNYVCLIEAE